MEVVGRRGARPKGRFKAQKHLHISFSSASSLPLSAGLLPFTSGDPLSEPIDGTGALTKESNVGHPDPFPSQVQN